MKPPRPDGTHDGGRRSTLLLWLLVLIASLPLASGLEARLETAARVTGSDHERVAQLLRSEFDSAFADPLILVASGIAPHDAITAEQLSHRLTAALEVDPHVAGLLSYENTHDALFLGAEGQGAVILVRPIDPAGAMDATLTQLRALTAMLERELRGSAPALSLQWTGAAALNADLRRVSAAEAQAAEARVMPLVLLLLLLVFRSIPAALLPAVAGMVCIPIALGIAALASHVLPLSIVLINVVSMLGLGLSIDYALLMVGRFREELAAGHDGPAAARRTRRSAGHTILLSAAGIAVGFAALLLVPINEIRSIAVGGLIVLAVAVLLACTLLPALLARLGSRINAWPMPWPRRWSLPHGAWSRATGALFRRPALFLLCGLAPLLLLGAHALDLRISLPRGEWLPRSAASVRAMGQLQAMGQPDLSQLIEVLVRLPAGVSVDDPRGRVLLADVSRQLGHDPRVGAVRELSTAAALAPTAGVPITVALPQLHRMFASHDLHTALVALIPAAGTDSGALTELVRDIRAGRTFVLHESAAAVLVGGLPALNADYEDSVRSHTPAVVATVLGVSFLMLLIGFRSVAIALKAVLLNVISVAASLGALVWVFQDGVFPNIPILAFCIVFGLSMDYEVFLFHRVLESHRAGRTDEESMDDGLRLTAKLIASAALIMIAVFGAFCLGEFLFIRMLGFTLAVAVLIDATLVRLLLGPAIFALAGRWNWWPGPRLDRPR